MEFRKSPFAIAAAAAVVFAAGSLHAEGFTDSLSDIWQFLAPKHGQNSDQTRTRVGQPQAPQANPVLVHPDGSATVDDLSFGRGGGGGGRGGGGGGRGGGGRGGGGGGHGGWGGGGHVPNGWRPAPHGGFGYWDGHPGWGAYWGRAGYRWAWVPQGPGLAFGYYHWWGWAVWPGLAMAHGVVCDDYYSNEFNSCGSACGSEDALCLTNCANIAPGDQDCVGQCASDYNSCSYGCQLDRDRMTCGLPVVIP